MSQQQDHGEYVCANCKKKFKRTRSLEAAAEQAIKDEPLEKQFVEVCKDCYLKIKTYTDKKEVKRRLFLESFEQSL